MLRALGLIVALGKIKISQLQMLRIMGPNNLLVFFPLGKIYEFFFLMVVFKTVSHSHRWLITFALNYTNLSYCTSRISNIHQLYSDRAGDRTLHHRKRVHANIFILGIPNDLVTTNTLTKMRWSNRNSERNI